MKTPKILSAVHIADYMSCKNKTKPIQPASTKSTTPTKSTDVDPKRSKRELLEMPKPSPTEHVMEDKQMRYLKRVNCKTPESCGFTSRDVLETDWGYPEVIKIWVPPKSLNAFGRVNGAIYELEEEDGERQFALIAQDADLETSIDMIRYLDFPEYRGSNYRRSFARDQNMSELELDRVLDKVRKSKRIRPQDEPYEGGGKKGKEKAMAHTVDVIKRKERAIADTLT